MNETLSNIRDFVNRTSRYLLSEPLRKKVVEAYYAGRAMHLNRNSTFAPHTGNDLIDRRLTLGYRIKCSRGVYRGNCFYGAAYWMQRYAGVKTALKACVEHGVYFGNYVNEAELDGSGLPCLITFGPARVSHVAEVSDVPVIPVGPYIAYASDYLSQEETNGIKALLGNTLLVFPSHSVDRVKVRYEIDDLIAEIKRVTAAHSIDSVLVCLYYRDILNGAAEAYEQHEFTVVTAGYREDVLFLSRLRSLIGLADLTMSNGVGTHVGYCAYLGKPHYVYRQEKLFEADGSADAIEFDNPYKKLAEQEKTEVAQAFDSFENDLLTINGVCEKYWGFRNVLANSKMAELIELCDQAYGVSPKDRQSLFRENLPSSLLGESIE